MKLSIVSTLYQSEAYIEDFCKRISDTAKTIANNEYEIILVNDGSPDNSLKKAIDLIPKYNNLTIIDLSRNFGHHKAMMTGLKQATGERIFLIDSDLEEQPEWLSTFNSQMDNTACDVIYGVQKKRRGSIFEKISGWFFYRFFRLVTGIQQPNNIVTARLMTRRYVKALTSHQEREINIGGLWVITGFNQQPQVIKKLENSPTTYSLSRKLNHLINAVTSFSSLPLVTTFYVGLFTSLTAVLYIIYLIYNYIIAQPPDGYTTLVASIWFFSGLIIFFLGLQGIYLAKIFSEVKQRPYTIIRQIYNSNGGL